MTYKIKERYKVQNVESDDNGRFLTIIKIEKDTVYYMFDGQEDIHYFQINSIFGDNLIRAD